MGLIRIYLLIIISFCFSCKKDETEIKFGLPEKTQTGQNTIGFKVNGQVWVKYGKHCTFLMGGCRENPSIIYRPSNNGDIIFYSDRILKKDGKIHTDDTFGFYKYKDFATSTTHNIKYIKNYSDVYLSDEISGKSYGCIPSRETMHFTISRLDTVAKVLAGEFSGVLFNRASLKDSIIISDGRFDLSLVREWF